MRKLTPLVLLTPFALAACGGSTTSGNVAAYNAKIASHTNPLAAEFRNSTITALASRPVEDSATMTGTFELDAPSTVTDPTVEGVAGLIDLTANFASGAVTGRTYGYIETYTGNTAIGIEGSGILSGSVNVQAGTNNDITASGSGTAQGSDGTNYTVNTTINGDMYRRSGGELASAGAMNSTITGGGSTHFYSGIYRVTE